jgi:hypothetical protein
LFLHFWCFFLFPTCQHLHTAIWLPVCLT